MLLDDLLCPTTVTIGVDRLIHATGFASGLNSAGWVKLSDLTKGNISFPVPVSEIPGLVGNTSGAYAAVNNSSATPGNLFQVPPPTVTFLCSVGNPIGGVALLGPHLFFTTRQKGGVNGGLYQRSIGSTLPLQQVWMGTDPHGPVAANGTHVYWTQNDTIFRADAADPFKTLEHKGIPTTVRSLAADDQRVWIGHNLGLRAFGVNLDAAGEDIITAGTPVHGIVAEGGGVYFTQGDTLYQVVLGVVTAKVSGFIAPRGVAQDGSNVYVADQGSCSSLSDGKIVKVPK